MQIVEDIHSHEIDRVEGPYAGETLSVHVVEISEATVQFGSGDDLTVATVSQVLEEHDVDVLVAEHGDPDHYGGMTVLQDEFDVEIAVPAADAHVLADVGIDVDVHLEPDEVYWGIETIGVPGHSPGNMSFLYDDVLVAGDSAVGSDFGRAADESWSGPLAVLGPDSHVDETMARENVSRLLEYDFEVVLVTHGSNVLSDGKQAVETLVEDLSEE